MRAVECGDRNVRGGRGVQEEEKEEEEGQGRNDEVEKKELGSG